VFTLKQAAVPAPGSGGVVVTSPPESFPGKNYVIIFTCP